MKVNRFPILDFRRDRAAACSGFAMIEATLATVIVGVLLVAAMQAASASSLAQYKAAERATARYLAQGLMSEIIRLAYQSPAATPLFGREAGESSSSRSNYDDVDDYNGWTETPPSDLDGNALPGLTGWSRSVAVAWVSPQDPTSVSATETGAKRITVTVSHKGLIVATLVAVRTNAP